MVICIVPNVEGVSPVGVNIAVFVDRFRCDLKYKVQAITNYLAMTNMSPDEIEVAPRKRHIFFYADKGNHVTEVLIL